jgi:hypothetical protein
VVDLYLVTTVPYTIKFVDLAASLSLVTSGCGNKGRTRRGVHDVGR